MERLPATRGTLAIIVVAVCLAVAGVPIAEWLWPVSGGMLLTAAVVDAVRQQVER